MEKVTYVVLIVLGLFACSVERSAIAPRGGEIGESEDCADISFAVANAFMFQCPENRIDISWDAPALPATCLSSLGTGCIEPPGGLGPVCTDLWTDPIDLTAEPTPGALCTVERRAAGGCAFCRYPNMGFESISPPSDVAIRYFAQRTYDAGLVNECFAERLVQIVPYDRTRPHTEDFTWTCDDEGAGRWTTVEWDPTEFATSSIRLTRITNISPAPVDVLLQRNESGRDVVHNARNILPGADLPPEFLGGAHGLWSVSPNPPDRFEPAACPEPRLPSGSTRGAPIPFTPFNVPPPMVLLFELECTADG